MYDNDVPSQPADNGRTHKSHENGSPQPVTGILDIVDNRAFVRTDSYLPGPRDAPVPLGLVRAHGLRRGDTVTGTALWRAKTRFGAMTRCFSDRIRLRAGTR
jgi:transcription termination factor Rho